MTRLRIMHLGRRQRGRRSSAQSGATLILALIVIMVMGVSIGTYTTRQELHSRNVERIIARDRAALTLERRIMFAQTLLSRGMQPTGLVEAADYYLYQAETKEESLTGPPFRFSVQAKLAKQPPYQLLAWEMTPPLATGRRSVSGLVSPGQPSTIASSTAPITIDRSPKAAPAWVDRMILYAGISGILVFAGLLGALFIMDANLGRNTPFS